MTALLLVVIAVGVVRPPAHDQLGGVPPPLTSADDHLEPLREPWLPGAHDTLERVVL